MAASVAKIAFGVGCGILLAIAALFGGCVVLMSWGMLEQEAETAKALSSIEVIDLESEQSETWITVRGSVRNSGSEPVKFVTVRCELVNSSGRVVDSDTTYAVGSDALAPGASKSFDMMIRRPSSGADRYQCSVIRD